MEQWLEQLVAQGKQTGSLTFDEVNAVLPETWAPDVLAPMLDRLLDALESHGISIIDDEPEEPLVVPPPTTDSFSLPESDAGDSTYTEVYRRDADFEQQLRALDVPFHDAMCFRDPDNGRVFDAELLVPGEQALAAWLALRNAARETGMWPVIGDDLKDPANWTAPGQVDPLGRAAEWWREYLKDSSVPLRRLTPAEIRAGAAANIAEAAKVPPEPWTFRGFRGQGQPPPPPNFPNDDREPPEPNLAELFSNAGPFRAHKQGGGHPDYPTHPFVRLRLYPTAVPWEVFAYDPFGGWNDCPWPDEQLAMLRHWHELCGVEVVSHRGDWYELFVPRPPRSRHLADRLEKEMRHFGEESFYSYGSYAHPDPIEAIRASHYWYFWWD